MNQGVDGTKLGPQPAFYDEKIISESRYIIRQVAENIILTASVFIGYSDLAEELISIEKIESFFTHLNKTLGFITNFR